MAIRAVLFDWGGTLVDGRTLSPSAPVAAVAAQARRFLHLAISDTAFEEAFAAVLPPHDPGHEEAAPPIGALIAAAFARLGWSLDPGDLAECARRFVAEATFADTLYSEARGLIASLRYRGYRMGVVTNSLFPAPLFEPWLREQGLTGSFDAFVSSADVGRAKPHRAPFEAALLALGIPPQEALFVGDTVETDIAGALRVGMRAVLVDRSGQRKEGAGYLVIRSLSALNGILGEGLSPAASGEEGFGIIEQGP